MKIKKFEKFEPDMEPHEQDPYYEIWKLDINGDEVQLDYDAEIDCNPYDLNEIAEAYLKLKGYNKNWFIKKITEEIVDLTAIPEIDLILKSKKYNL